METGEVIKQDSQRQFTPGVLESHLSIEEFNRIVDMVSIFIQIDRRVKSERIKNEKR